MPPAHRHDAAQIESRLDSAALLLVSSRSLALLHNVIFDSHYTCPGRSYVGTPGTWE